MKLKAKFNSHASIERDRRAHYHHRGMKTPVPAISMRRLKKAYMKAKQYILPSGPVEREVARQYEFSVSNPF